MPLALRMREAAAGVSGAIITDSFTRADSALTLGSADTGQAWTATNATWGISSNQAYSVTNTDGNIAIVDAAVTDVAVSAASFGLTAAGAFFGIIARYVDGSHYYLAQFQRGTGLQLYKNNSGFTQLGSTAAGTAWVSGDVFTLTVKGTTISAAQNGTVLISVTDSALAVGTKVGFRLGGGGAATRWDDLSVVAS